MKLAEALIERKAIKTKIENIKHRIYQNAKIQEGDSPIENPIDLFGDLEKASKEFASLVVRINKTNLSVKIDNSTPLMEALIQKDMLNLMHMVHVNLCEKAVPEQDRYSNREIKYVPNVDITAVRKDADKIAMQYRELDKKIQECNWTTELLS